MKQDLGLQLRQTLSRTSPSHPAPYVLGTALLPIPQTPAVLGKMDGSKLSQAAELPAGQEGEGKGETPPYLQV